MMHERVATLYGPRLELVATLLSVGYLADLVLTFMGHSFIVDFHELNPFVSHHVNSGSWWYPTLLKLFGVVSIWCGVALLHSTPYRGHYAWLLGLAAIFYLMLDLYQVVLLL